MTLLKTDSSTILVVDDSKTQASFIKNILDDDYETVLASSGLEGLEVYKEMNPDLILLDIEMPHMNGYEVCRRLKAMTEDTFVPVIFLTSKSDLDSLTMGLHIGGEDYLTKPFAPEELKARVQAALRTKKRYSKLETAHATVEKERDTIANIQKGLLCDEPPAIQGMNFFSDYQPSSKAGGDYYDFIPIDQDHLGVLISDVSGHGTPSAVIMAMMRVLLSSFASQTHSPKATLQKLNKILRQNLETGYFITTFYGVIHLPTKTMKYASAGHPPPVFINYNTESVIELWTNKGIPLMILPNNEMEEGEIQLEHNCKLTLYTDGLTEAKNELGEMFGAERLTHTLHQLGKNRDATELGNRVKEEIQEFMGKQAFADDYTLVILEVTE
ncbi:MAG: fused response regulator/phosphatase [Nitrospinaceae bacterium]|nr:MAG: fused response regulator/phosphatase [Nitrospinaceae bacterium]